MVEVEITAEVEEHVIIVVKDVVVFVVVLVLCRSCCRNVVELKKTCIL